MKTNNTKQGFVLMAVMMLIVIASLVGGAFLMSALRTNTVLERWNEHDKCLLAVQAGLEAINYSLYTNLLSDIYANGNRRDALGVLDGLSYSGIEVVVEDGFAIPPDLNIGGAVAVNLDADGDKYAARKGSPFLFLALHPALFGYSGRMALRSVLAGNPLALLTGVSGSSDDIVTVSVNVNTLSYNNDAASNSSDVFLQCEAKATYGESTRAIREEVLYKYNGIKTTVGGDNSVFDNVFFIDNQGYFSGVNCDFNGDIKANKDVNLQYSSIRLQGDAYAGGECTSHKLYKSYDWSKYGDQSFAGIYFGDRVRPMLYTDGNRSNPDTYYEQGYAEGVNFYEAQEKEDLPFIGPLSDYEDYATLIGGTASDASTFVNAVWGDDVGEDAGLTNSPIDDGCLVLIGTETDPINLNGVVVARKDLYIGGYYTGQGSLYAGRNIFVINDLIAKDPPSWSHPDSNPQSTADANKTKDFMGLSAKGNLVFGDYRDLDVTYLKAPHTASHATDVSDAKLGYVSYAEDGEPYFDGDYTQPDGDGSEVRTDESTRRFYEPILSDADYAALNPKARIGWFDAVLYANHLIAGDFDEDAVLNGGFVCRDEAVKQHGNLAFNWDVRLGSLSLDGEAFYAGLPGMMLPATQPMPSRTIQWTEIDPDDV